MTSSMLSMQYILEKLSLTFSKFLIPNLQTATHTSNPDLLHFHM